MICRTFAMTAAVLATAVLVASLAGCGGPIYRADQVVFQEAITPRLTWTVNGNLQGLAAAIDDNLVTAAVSAGDYSTPTLTIDLGKPCLFNMVVVEHGAEEFGYAHRLVVSTSEDGQSFRRQTTVAGLRRVTTVVLPRQALARYVRLEAIEPGPRAWSVAEVYLN